MLTATIVTEWEKLRLAVGGQQRTEIRGDRRVTRKAVLMATQWDNLKFFGSLSTNETANQTTRQISTASHRLAHLSVIFLWQIRSAYSVSYSIPVRPTLSALLRWQHFLFHIPSNEHWAPRKLESFLSHFVQHKTKSTCLSLICRKFRCEVLESEKT